MLDDLVVDHIHHVLKHQSVTKEFTGLQFVH